MEIILYDFKYKYKKVFSLSTIEQNMSSSIKVREKVGMCFISFSNEVVFFDFEW